MSLLLYLRKSSFDIEAVAYDDTSTTLDRCNSDLIEAYDLFLGSSSSTLTLISSLGNSPGFTVCKFSTIILGAGTNSSGLGDFTPFGSGVRYSDLSGFLFDILIVKFNITD